jgi:NADPH:quinone reductase-like Zn-dependent oxidoreductase
MSDPLLVEVRAVSVNPVDYKVRASAPPPAGTAKVIGYDAAGVVVEAGPQSSLFRPGDEVFYAGSIIRSGTNAEFHLVDERIVGHKPRSLGFAEAAALPLTSITAWEALFDRMDIRKPVVGAPPSVLIIGGAGGVSSIAIQLVRALTELTVVATASRPETRSWVKNLGAHHALDAANRRHGGAACTPRQRCRAGRRRQNPHHSCRALRCHQCGEPQARARAARNRQGPRQDRAGGVLIIGDKGRHGEPAIQCSLMPTQPTYLKGST